jgi:hypothetical protein
MKSINTTTSIDGIEKKSKSPNRKHQNSILEIARNVGVSGAAIYQ